MWFIISCLISQYLFYRKFEFANAMIGENVRTSLLNEFPFVVSIKQINNANNESENDHGCTGTVISKQHIVTIAHYLDVIPLTRIELIVGSIDLRSNNKFNVSKITTYNQWFTKNDKATNLEINDISIIEVLGDLPNEITPVVLSPLSIDALYGSDVVTVGWGKMINNKISRFMKTVRLRIITKTECKHRIEQISGRSTNTHEKYLCTIAVPYAFLRNGDSGGPLLLNNQLIGINKGTSPFREDNFNPAKVNIHVIIDNYREFIKNVTGVC